MECPAQATVLREGPAHDHGPGAAWLAYLCPGHAADLDGWPGSAEYPDTGTMPCGPVLDYRSGEQQLQSHADLWLTPLTGVDPATHGGWADVLDQADRVLLARVDEAAAAGEDSREALKARWRLARRALRRYSDTPCDGERSGTSNGKEPRGTSSSGLPDSRALARHRMTWWPGGLAGESDLPARL
ncbi:conserved hypothetical protein [Streptomyces sp. C]|nr:conserved hypothetical protein [Streptomyces sp. C]